MCPGGVKGRVEFQYGCVMLRAMHVLTRESQEVMVGTLNDRGDDLVPSVVAVESLMV